MIPRESTGVTGKKRGVLARFLQQVTGGVEPKMWLFKFVPLLILQSSSIFAYTMLKNTKNAVFMRVTTSTIFGFLKILVIWPLAIIFPISLSYITKALRGKREKVPYVMLSVFIGFFLIFMFIILPNSNYLQFPQLAQKLASTPFLPAAIADGLGGILGYWDYSIFYGVSEMVAVVFINMLSWGVANEICSADESKTFYPIFAGLTALATYQAAGIVLKSKLSATSSSQFMSVLQGILGKAVLALLVFLVAYLFIERFVMKNPALVTKKEAKVKTKPQGAGFSMVWNNTYLRNIGIIVLSYSLLVFMLEQCWYESIIVANKSAYSSVIAKTNQITAVMTFIMSLLGVFLGRFPWVVRAMLPVVMMGGGGLLAIGLYAVQPTIAGVASIAAISSFPMMVVVFGCVGNVMSRSSKYTLFDATKEELFRSSIDPNIRSQVKSVIDVVCGRVGKSGSALMVTSMLVLAPYFTKFIGHRLPQIHSSKSDPARDKATAVVKKLVNIKTNQDGSALVTFNSSGVKQLGSNYIVSEKAGVIEISIPREEITQNPTQSSQDQIVPKDPVKTPIKNIAPAIFIVVACLVVMWGYAVLSIAPKYEENIAQTEGVDKARSPSLNLNNFIALISLSGTMCGIIYFVLQKEITPLLKIETAK